MFPKQTDLDTPDITKLGHHIKEWGCLGCDLIYGVADFLGFADVVTKEEILDCFAAGIKAGYMLDDNNPVNHADENSWHRVEFQNQEGMIGFMEMVAKHFDNSVKVKFLGSRGSSKAPLKLSQIDSIPAGCNFIQAKYKDIYKHFVVLDCKTGPISIKYNPDPSLKLEYLISLGFYQICQA